MSDNDLIRRGDALKVWTDGAVNGRTYDEIRIALDKIPAIPQEMTASEFIDIVRRMKRKVHRCKDCGLEHLGCDLCDGSILGDYAVAGEFIVNRVKDWAADHPEKKRKTYAEDFREKYPNANLWDSDYPLGLCRKKLYGQPLCEMKCRETTCSACWSEEMEVQDG